MADKEVISVKLNKQDLANILELLLFSYKTASFLAGEEVKKGTIIAARDMQQRAELAVAYHALLAKHVSIGEPPTEQSH